MINCLPTYLTNTLTSLFVGNTIISSQKDQSQVIAMELEKKERYVEKFRTFYELHDTDGEVVVPSPVDGGQPLWEVPTAGDGGRGDHEGST